jgi:hypothetical protein
MSLIRRKTVLYVPSAATISIPPYFRLMVSTFAAAVSRPLLYFTDYTIAAVQRW